MYDGLSEWCWMLIVFSWADIFWESKFLTILALSICIMCHVEFSLAMPCTTTIIMGALSCFFVLPHLSWHKTNYDAGDGGHGGLATRMLQREHDMQRNVMWCDWGTNGKSISLNGVLFPQLYSLKTRYWEMKETFLNWIQNWYEFWYKVLIFNTLTEYIFRLFKLGSGQQILFYILAYSSFFWCMGIFYQ